ncbi:MAG: methylmalonyl Co-A mutase-associated GTPase MeaB [candidate division Zixibacteria bacterium]|nr:methylmalonyl Co-A mutase-associated GTPase MeaB [candidate division Zixibacteria bacterium]
MTLFEAFQQGDIRALSRLVSHVENRADGYQKLLEKLYAKVGRALRVGITGPPGSGKSTLVNLLTHEFIARQQRVGIIAVDPSSPFTGGALLGDRVRMNEFPSDGRVYFRSMATRGATGGLAAATDNVTVVYDAFGFDITLIETVGVGQVELDIIDTCDVVVVVIVPESGDAVQTMKAGLMEIADIFCVNKSDRPGAERIAAELRMAMETRKRVEGAWAPSVIATEAVNRKGIDRLHNEIHRFVDFARSSGQFEKHRREQVRRKILSVLKARFQQEFLDKLASEGHVDEAIEKILSGTDNPYRIGDRLYQQFTK